MLSKYATTIAADSNGMINVTYHSTVIVSFDNERVVLNSGGYETVTTKKKMNQAADQFGLGYQVFQKDYIWFVGLPNGETVKFFDGMIIDRV
jgi:hypothetical protein